MDDLAEIEKAIYEQSFRTLDEQAKVLGGLRVRAGALVGIANVATAFLGGIALTGGGVIFWPAIAFFLVAILLGLYVLMPRPDWVFSHHPHDLLATITNAEAGPRLSDFRREIALHNGIHYDANVLQLRLLNRCYSAATVSLVAELMMWMWALAT